MEPVVLDSSAVIAFYNSADKHHKKIVAEVSASSARFLISTITLTESMVAAYRVSEGVAQRMLVELTRAFAPFIEIDTDISLAAAKLRAKSALATPDAIISASATKVGAALWSFDRALAKAHPQARLLG